MYKYNKLWVYLFIIPTLIVFLTFYFVPILTVFTTGFTEWNGFNAPKFIGLANYKMMFFDDNSITVR